MKSMRKRILKNLTTGHERAIFMSNIPVNDYLFYAKYYTYKNGKIVGRWRGLGWFTTESHAIRSFRRLFSKDKWQLLPLSGK